MDAEKRDVGLTALASEYDLAVCPPIVYEVLRGANTRKRYETLRSALLRTIMLDAAVPLERFEYAANLYLRCRDVGYTVPGLDCLIAACAIANGAELLHRDRDYELMAEIAPLQVRRL